MRRNILVSIVALGVLALASACATSTRAPDRALTSIPQFALDGPIEGFHHICFGTGCLKMPESKASLERQRQVGAKWVRILALWHMSSPTSNRVEQMTVANGYKTNASSDEDEVVGAIRQAKALGLKVILAPGVEATGASPIDIKPRDARAWFDSYKSFILRFARVAQQEGVAQFSIGQEYTRMSTSKFTSYWKELAQAVRVAYTGPISYQANYGNDLKGREMDDFSGVAPFVDRLGFDVYAHLASTPLKHASILRAAWMTIFEKLRSVHSSTRNGWGQQLPVFVGEVGYESLPAAARPNTTTPETRRSPSLPADEDAQAACYEALFYAWRAQGPAPWFLGAMFWEGGGFPAADPADFSKGFTPIGKKAESLIREFWSKH